MSRPTLDPARRLGISDTRLSLSPAGLPSPFSYLTSATTQSEPRDARITVWALSISLAATLEIDKFSFSSSGYLDVSVPRVPFHTLWIGVWIREVCSRGFPHSEICGSQNICFSPQLIAACHVLRRLSVPRHPPCALYSLTFIRYIALYLTAFLIFIISVCFLVWHILSYMPHLGCLNIINVY